MNFSFRLPFTRPSHTEVRYVHGTRTERTEAQRRYASRKASIVAQLAVYNATTSPEQRARETEERIADLRAKALRRASARKRAGRRA